MRKSFDVTVEAKDGGSIRAYASTFDREPDSYGDVIAPTAFDKTLEKWRELGKPIPLLWGHDTNDPFSNIGACTDFGTDERGLWYEAEFDAENPKAQYVRKLAQEGRVYQCSFAFACNDAGEVELEDGRKANELRELDLFEISVVQIPANQFATIESAKDGDPEQKAGRRNSKADEEMLREAATLLSEAEERIDQANEIINAVLGGEGKDDEEAVEEPEEEAEQAKSEEAETAQVVDMYKTVIKEFYR